MFFQLTARSYGHGQSAAYHDEMFAWDGPQAPLLVGRFRRGDDGVTFAWPGSSLSVRFWGRGASVDLTDSGQNRFLVCVDGHALPAKLAPPAGRSRLQLASGLTETAHTLTLYKLTESLCGATTVHGWNWEAGGHALPSPPPATRRIELIGDSISAGYGNEGADFRCAFSPDTENHFVTYGALAARRAKADLTTLAWSGRGVFSNRGSTTETETMSVLWERTLPSDPSSSWGFEAPPPHAVVLNLGSNDFAPEVPDVTPFGPAYERLLGAVRARYPAAHVWSTVGPLLRDDGPDRRPALGIVRATLRAIVAARRAAGDDRVHFLEFAPTRPEEGHGCDYHPSLLTHDRMAGELLASLKPQLGWD